MYLESQRGHVVLQYLEQLTDILQPERHVKVGLGQLVDSGNVLPRIVDLRYVDLGKVLQEQSEL